ncbi:MAG: DNA ligase-associated DEXH box helicase, partial [Bacteroidia bacterium]
SDEAFAWAVDFITTGGAALKAYPDFSKAVWEQGHIKVKDRRTAMRHRLNMGTIVSDPSLKVKYQNGMFLGTVEEWFLAKIQPGDAFWFGGRVLELLYVRDLIATVKPSKKKQGTVPQWMGGRMPLSSCLSDFLRNEMDKVARGIDPHLPEIAALEPIFKLQAQRSHIPRKDELLVEYLERKEGYHLLVYPFEGRLVHEGMASLLALRISRMSPSSFSIGMNDYGFEILSPKPIPVEEALELDVFSIQNLRADINESINAAELSRRKFREIAAIAGLIFQGYPGKAIGTKHLQSSSRLLYDVFSSYDESNLLLHQAREEVFDFQLEEKRLKDAFRRIEMQSIVLKKIHQFTPLSFPIVVDRLREQMSNEPIEERIKRLIDAQTA